MVDLFSEETPSYTSVKRFVDYAKAKDKKGAVDYLRKLTNAQFEEEVLKAGFSTISARHGLRERLKAVIDQF